MGCLNCSVCSVLSLDVYSALTLGSYDPCSRTCDSGLAEHVTQGEICEYYQTISSTPRPEGRNFGGIMSPGLERTPSK